MKFSKQLVERTQKYFKEKYSLDISEDTAVEYLFSLSGFFMAFGGVASAVVPLPAGDAGGAPDLITPHSC